MLKSAVQTYVGHQMVSATGTELCTYQKFRIWLRTVENMGLLLSLSLKLLPELVALCLHDT